MSNSFKKTFLDRINNAVLILSGLIFCFNIITNVFIQIDFGYILRDSALSSGYDEFGVVPTEPGTGKFLIFN